MEKMHPCVASSPAAVGEKPHICEQGENLKKEKLQQLSGSSSSLGMLTAVANFFSVQVRENTTLKLWQRRDFFSYFVSSVIK